MIDLRKYYLDNVTEDDYYYRFYPLIEGMNRTHNVFFGEQVTEDHEFLVYDDDEAIEKFRLLCRPGGEPERDEEKCWFYLVAYYLNAHGYVIEQFPDVLGRPPKEPSRFTYGAIADRVVSLGWDDAGTVRWATRRAIVADMKFTRCSSSIAVGESLAQKIKLISAGNTGFDDMQADEKLREIANLIEHLLKENGKFIQPDYSKVAFGYVDDSVVKRLRGQLQCFRHSSAEMLDERAKFTDEQKSFLVDFGVTVCKAIYALVE